MTPTKKILIAATALVSAGGLTAAGAIAQQADEKPMMKMHAQHRTIAVTGTGEASAKPDMATINFSVEARGDTAAEALAENNKQMNAAMTAIRRAGVAEKDMQTTGLYMNTQNVRGPDGSWTNEIDYYEARNTLTVKVRDIDDTGAVIDAAVKAGINGLGGITYGFGDNAALLEEARKDAVADAREKAALYAAEAGVSLGEVLYIAEPGASAGPPFPMVRMEAASMDSATKVAPGESSVSASVNIVFAIN